MKPQLRSPRAGLPAAALLLGSLALLPAGEVGPMYAPPAPVSDCDACNAPGFYLDAAVLYLNNISESSTYDGDWDFGGRLALGFERPDGLFYEIEGFWYQGDGDYSESPFRTYEVEHTAIDFLIGDNLHCGEACLDIAFGLRYASYERERTYSPQAADTTPPPNGGPVGTITEFEFDGWGPTIQLEATRQMGGPWSIYGEFQQSLLFGEAKEYWNESASYSKKDTLGLITEIAAGIQYDFGTVMGGVSEAHVRFGGEGQYWVMDSSDLGLYGAALSVGFTF